MLSDIEIAQNATCKPLNEVAPELSDILEPYGKYMAKILPDYIDENKIKQHKLILVTSITPNKSGIGKTTVSIGLTDGMCKLDKKAVAVLREPSLGPCFGMKGGACGGGYAQVIPMEKINLHFTGDFHAITAANNLIAAAADNLKYHAEKYNFRQNIKEITYKRCLDVNDRSLRKIFTYDRNNELVQSGFNITAASELMAIFCLSKNMDDLYRRVKQIIIGTWEDDTPIYAGVLGIEGSIVALLLDAFKPNLVQTLENNPVIIHGGPFANIAHGCNSVVATKLGMTYYDYVITEAGFGADLGAEKFLDIKCRNNDLWPDCIVIAVTLPALKQWAKPEDPEVDDIKALEYGICNLQAHINALRKRNIPLIVAYNQHNDDALNEIQYLQQSCEDMHIKCVTMYVYTAGSVGAIELANEVINICDNHVKNTPVYPYNMADSLRDKIYKICTEVYGYDLDVQIKIKESVLDKYNQIAADTEYSHYPVCIAKTQYSMTDNAKVHPIAESYKKFNITDIEVNRGAEFIVVSAGNMMRMPGLPAYPNAQNIDVIDNKIIGLS